MILAGGSGSRLSPLTQVTNKHLLPVYDRPMIFHAVDALVRAGIRQIVIVTGGAHGADFAPLLGDGSAFGADLQFVDQPRPAGIADALNRARPLVSGAVCLYLGDNLFERRLGKSLERFRAQPRGARVLLAAVEHPEAYGIALVREGRVADIVEKPSAPQSRMAVTGCYFYDPTVFDLIPTLVASGRGELEITDVNNAYLQRGELEYDVVDGYWVDCGESFGAYLRAQNLVAERGVNL